ncbi:MAG: aminotransferase class III-fold pyridoxal phosphate-dependent enzyme [Acidimicrobiia bacterium]|nr:aminotransferase class III-fold pyridoxal phosphate-dependent enzyme [Acidimicrobiia bacterium]
MSTPAFLHPFAAPRRADFTTIVGGEGAELWDDTGKRYIDGMASLWYMNIGYGRQEMAEAIAAEVSKLGAYHTFERFSCEPTDRLAELIVDYSPFDRARVFFGSGGSDAVDTALKMARVAQREAGHPEKTVILSRDRGYHGTHFGGTTAQGLAPNKEGWGALVPDIVNVAGHDLEAMTRAFAEHEGRIAAVISEPVQGAGGVFPPPEGYLEGLRRLCDEAGAYLILDEVICGFGRLGTWFGAQYFGVEADMITFAKAVTSGYAPLGGVICGPAVCDALEANEGFVLRHGYTYSGHPMATAAGLKALEIQEREGLMGETRRIGDRLSKGLHALASDGLVTEVRGLEAVWAVALPEGRDPVATRDAALDRGVIVRPVPGNSLSMCPPLVISDDQIDQIVDVLAEVLA